MRKIMIVESAKKAKLIQGFLGKDYVVVACGGHIREMVKGDGVKDMGFDENYNIQYAIIENKERIVSELKKAHSNKAFDKFILAADPDREGESIALSIVEELKLSNNDYVRCTYNEITETAIKKAVQDSLDKNIRINRDLTNAQEARRILDRYVGWKGYAAISAYYTQPLPMGRVQSPVVMLVVEQDEKIANFKETPFVNVVLHGKDKLSDNSKKWTLKLDIKSDTQLNTEITERNTGIVISKSEYDALPKEQKKDYVVLWKDETQAKELETAMLVANKQLTAKHIDKRKEGTSQPPAPYTTSKMQQDAIRTLKISGKKVDEFAQDLYEKGYITYPRTDNSNISDEGWQLIKDYCESENLPFNPVKRTYNNGKNAQEAHECIRPTTFDNFTAIYQELCAEDKEKAKLYEMIFHRTVQSQLKDEIFSKESYVFNFSDPVFDVDFTGSIKVVIDKGYKAYTQAADTEENEDDSQSIGFLDIEVGEKIVFETFEQKQGKTSPPKKLTQATLNALLDRYQIGRPSTYSVALEKCKEHGYIDISSKQELTATQKAKDFITLVKDSFDIMNYKYTSQMEKDLDMVANPDAYSDSQAVSRNDFIRSFISSFDSNIETLQQKVATKEITSFVQFAPCPTESCEGRARLLTSKKTGKLFWSCKTCDELFSNKVEEDGTNRPITNAEKYAEYYNEDGSPKYTCPYDNCGGVLALRTSKKDPSKHFFTHIKDSDKKCGHDFISFIEQDGVKKPVTEEEWREIRKKERELEYFDENGIPKYICPYCEGALKRVESKTGNIWFYHLEEQETLALEGNENACKHLKAVVKDKEYAIAFGYDSKGKIVDNRPFFGIAPCIHDKSLPRDDLLEEGEVLYYALEGDEDMYKIKKQEFMATLAEKKKPSKK